MTLKYKIFNKKNLYSGFFSMNKYEFIHQKHNGEWTSKVEREIFEGVHVSSLLPYDPIKKEIILIQQFRAGVLSRYDKNYLYEVVAGIIDEGENPEETAIRECLEETGSSYSFIFFYPTQGIILKGPPKWLECFRKALLEVLERLFSTQT